MPLTYAVYLRREAVDYIGRQRPAERQSLWKLIEGLGSAPYSSGDFSDMSTEGERLEAIIRGRHVVTFWSDHAVKEVRVVDVGPADR